MLEQKLTTYFARFKTLSPRAGFVPSSQARIVTQTQRAPLSWRSRIFESVTMGGALALASMLLVLVLGSISYISKQSGAVATTSSDPDAQALLREASQLASSVQIKEVDQFNESSEQVVSALDTLSKKTSVQ